MSSAICVLCSVYSGRQPAAAAEGEQTCHRCRSQLERDVAAVQSMHEAALRGDPEVADTRRTAKGAVRDAISYLLPMAATPPPSRQPRVSGTRERTVPVNVRLLDLTGPARSLGIAYFYSEDQIGEVSVASVLSAWIQHWRREGLWPGDEPTSSARTAEELARRLLAHRLDTIADRDPRIPLFAWQMRTLRRSLQSLLGDTVPYPAVMWGVPCRRCNLVSTLILDLEDPDHYRECTACGLLLTEGEYKLWLTAIVEQLRSGTWVGAGGTGASPG